MTRNVKWYIKPNNFGDVLTPHILSYFDIAHRYVDDIADADTICVGSIARMATDGMTVFGSGVIRENERLNPNAIWKFVRGPLTRENVLKCGGTCPKIYGDAALLLPLICPESEKQYDVGIVPHYADYDYILHEYGSCYHVINVVNRDPLVVAREITKCRKIISSSLHGIICAHAYHIPTAWVRFSKLHGDGIKFMDHYASIGLSCSLSNVGCPKFTAPDRINLDLMIEVFGHG